MNFITCIFFRIWHIYEKNEKLLLYRWRNLVRLHFPYFAKKCSFMCQFHEIFRLFPVIIFEYCSRCFCRADFKNRKLNLFSIFSNTRIAHIKSISLNLSRYFRGDTQIVWILWISLAWKVETIQCFY